MIKIDHSTETDSDINPIEDKSESLETKGEDGKEEKQKPLM